MKKHLYKVALLSSTLLLVGCGGSSGSGSSTGDSNLGAQFQSQLDDIQRQLGEVTTMTAQNTTELTKAVVALADAKVELDSVQASPTAGSAARDAAQETYNREAGEVARLKAEAAEFEGKKAIFKRKSRYSCR
jgi:chromosome segregation ATPase